MLRNAFPPSLAGSAVSSALTDRHLTGSPAISPQREKASHTFDRRFARSPGASMHASGVFFREAMSSMVRKWLASLFLAALSVPGMAAENIGFYGLLRGRDLSPFGYLRLDMRPGFTAPGEPGTWSFESDFAYQNTWATSPEVEKYLNA